MGSTANGSAAAGERLPTGLVYHELYMWHNAGSMQNLKYFLQPAKNSENPETKRRLHNLLAVSGLLDSLHPLRPRPATIEELARVHNKAYVASVQAMSADDSKGHHTCGDVATFAPGGFDIAALAAGGVIAAVDEVVAGRCRNAYALVRPPGHHAERSYGMGFCVFNNVALAAAHARAVHGLQRIVVVDFDVHHGNGTQHIFEDDPGVLCVSLHQDSNYPLRSGYVTENGTGAGEGYTINVPLPPGSGSGAYRSAFDRVVLPALEAYHPELILVSAGYDACFYDPLGKMILGSNDYRYFGEALSAAADRLCGGRLVAAHEGGYSEVYVPYCGLAFVEALSGVRSLVADPYLAHVNSWGHQELQPHQDAVVCSAEALVEKLRQRCDSAKR